MVSNASVEVVDLNIIAARKPVSEFGIREKESVSQLFHLKSLDRQDTWYPTLRKTVWVLSQLHDFVNVRLFVGSLCFSLAKVCDSLPFSMILRKKPSTYADKLFFLPRRTSSLGIHLLQLWMDSYFLSDTCLF